MKIYLALSYSAIAFAYYGDRRLDTCGADGKRNAICYKDKFPEKYEHSRSVARLKIGKKGACTGWLVGNGNMLLTNNHCVGTQYIAGQTEFQFMSEAKSCRQNCDTKMACTGPTVVKGAVLITTSSKYDYTLLHLRDTEINLSEIFGSLKLRATGPVEGEAIYIPQHPNAYGKYISIFDAYNDPITIHRRAKWRGGGLYHSGDTDGGSSGSPVISQQDHRVVALHNLGGCGGWFKKKNSAVDIRNIVADLQRRGIQLE